jgi:hypothetical protein
MLDHAKSTFTIDQRDTSPAPWEGGQLAHARWTKTFTGELEGTSVIEALMLGLDSGSRVYIGVERFDCALRGREGAFVLLHTATTHDERHAMLLTIVDGSGTGELAGIRGAGEIYPDHTFVLSYELGD